MARIYTRTGDGGRTHLASGLQVSKASLRVAAYGDIDETNACIGLVRVHTGTDLTLEPMLARIQNELFDLGSDLACPPEAEAPRMAIPRIIDSQVKRLESEIDQLTAGLPPLSAFILPGGTAAAAALHLARTVCRRAERTLTSMMEAGETVDAPAVRYVNRLSDFLFVAARHANKDAGDVLWKSGATR